jgi:DNA (cytosine-5)-methyltransferase 1
MSKTIFLDLCSGIGGFALGAFNAGMRFDKHYFSEVDKFCIDVYSKHFPESVNIGDIRKVNGRKLQKGSYFICAGFPCQDISIYGKKAGIIKGKKSSLFYEIPRIAREVKASFILLENVSNLHRNGLYEVLKELNESGYNAVWFNLCSAFFNVPHKRERIFIFAYPIRIGFIASKIFKEFCIKEDYKKCRKKGKKQFFSFPHRINYSELRCENITRLCGTTDEFPCRVDRIKALGNAVDPEVTEFIFKTLIEFFRGEE